MSTIYPNKWSKLSLSIALPLALILGEQNLRAQTADTLRRSLTIVTSEQLEFSAQHPERLQLKPLPRPSLHPLSSSPVALPTPRPYPLTNPLSALPQLPSLWERDRQIGFVTASLGLRYNGYIRAGLRPLNYDDERLDLYLSGRYTNYQLKEDALTRKIKELGISLGGDYHKDLGKSLLDISATYGFERNPYYGFHFPASSPLGGGNLSPQLDSRGVHRLDTELSLTSLEREGEQWRYRFTPRLSFTQASGINPIETKHSSSELAPNLVLDVAHLLKRDEDRAYKLWLGLEAKASLFLYNASAKELIPKALGSSDYLLTAQTPLTNYRNQSLIRFLPYGQVEGDYAGGKYGTRLGISLDFYKERLDSRAMLRPFVEAFITWQNDWKLSLSLLGDTETNSLSKMTQELPYLYIGGGETTASVRSLSGALTLSGRIRPNLRLSLSLEHQNLKKPLNYLPTLHYSSEMIPSATPLPYYAVGYQPIQAPRGSASSIGAELSYLHEGQWMLTLVAKASGYSKELWGRTALLLDGEWRWVASKTWQAGVGYRLEGGRKYPTLLDNGAQSTTIEALPAQHLISADAIFRLAKSLDLHLDGQLRIGSRGQHYLAYTPQGVTFNLGIAYHF